MFSVRYFQWLGLYPYNHGRKQSMVAIDVTESGSDKADNGVQQRSK